MYKVVKTIKNIDTNNKYILGLNKAYLKNNEERNYYKYLIFNKFSNFVKFIENNKYNNYFELINKNVVNPYFDIDKIDLSINDFNKLIEKFIYTFNNYFNKTIEYNDILIFNKYKDENKNIIISSHLYIPKYNITKSLNKKFIEELDNFDNKIYNNNRLYCLPYNTKAKITKLKKHNYFLSHNNNKKHIDVKEYIITNVKDTIKLNMNIKQTSKTLVNNYLNIAMNNIIKTNNNNLKNQSINSKPIQINKYNIVKKFIEYLPTSFYINDNYLWKLTILYLQIYQIDIIEFLKYSATQSNDKYTYQDNLKYIRNNEITYNNLDYLNYNNFIDKCINPLNKKYNLNFSFKIANNWDTPKFREWLYNITKINNLDEIFNDKKPTDKTIYIELDDTNLLYIKNLTIKNIITNDINNFYIENYYKNNNDNEDIIFNDNKTIQLDLNNFLLNPNDKLFNINAKWGSGKTYLFMRLILEHSLNNNYKILLLTENNTLNKSLKTELTKTYKNALIQSHQDIKKLDKFNDNIDICISSIESIKKCNKINFDIIILDEFESLLNHLESTTLKYITPLQACIIVKKFIQKCKKIICLDADLSINRLSPINDLLNINNNKIHYSNFNKWDEYEFNIHFKLNEFYDKIFNDIENNKKIVIGTLEKKQQANLLNKMINEKYKSIKILYISGDGVYLNNIKIDKKDCLNNIENFIINNKIDVWIYTPSVKTGLSFNTENYFNKTYLLTSNKSICAREAIQMLFRVRNLEDKQINIYLTKLLKIVEEPSTEQFINFLNGSIKIANLEYKAHNEDFYNIDEFYLKIKIENLKEEFNKRYNFNHSFLSRLTKNHNIKVNLVFENKNEYKEIIEDVKKNKEILKLEHIENIAKTNYICFKQINEYQDNSQLSNEEIEQLIKRKHLNNYGFRKIPYYYDEYNKYIYNDIYGYIYSINDVFKYDKSYILHDNEDAINFITNKQHTDIADRLNYNIKFNSCWKSFNFETGLNKDNENFKNMIIRTKILKFFFKELFDKYEIIIYRDFLNIRIGDLKHLIKNNLEYIKNDFNKYVNLLNIRSFDFNKFCVDNKEHYNKLINILTNILLLYGFNLIKPNDKKNKQIYKIRTIKISKINPTKKQNVIYQHYYNNTELPPFIYKYNEEYIKDYITFRQCYLTNLNKKQKEFNLKNRLTPNDKPFKLFKYEYVKWNYINDKWIKFNSNKFMNYNINVPTIETKILKKDEHKEYIKYLILTEYIDFYNRIRLKYYNDNLDKNGVYHFNENDTEKCLFTDEDYLNKQYEAVVMYD